LHTSQGYRLAGVNQLRNRSEGHWTNLDQFRGPDPAGLTVPISVILPTYNSAQDLKKTLRSLGEQNYPNLEVVIIDASSTDQTVAVVHAAHQLKPRLYTVPKFDVYEMFNRGISVITGDYFSLLLPGDGYLSREALTNIVELIQRKEQPDLAYCGSLLREPDADPRYLFRPFSIDLLKDGKQPTTIQACWFRREVVRHLGRFDLRYKLRSSFDLLCRMSQEEGYTVVALPRYYIDHERFRVTPAFLLRRTWETFLIIYRNFGLSQAFYWFVAQKPLRLLIWGWKSLRASLVR
jgi:glycosyltransferase involved in cell wall biosynthesis